MMAKHAGHRKHHEQLVKLNELIQEDGQDVRIESPRAEREVESLEAVTPDHGREVVQGPRRKASADRAARRASIESKLAGARTLKDIKRGRRIAALKVVNSIFMLATALIALGVWTWLLTAGLFDAEWWAWAFWAASGICVAAFTIDAHLSIIQRSDQWETNGTK